MSGRACFSARFFIEASAGRKRKTPAYAGVFWLRSWESTQHLGPAFDFLGTPFGLPFLQGLVVAALGLDDFVGVRVAVLLDLARTLGGRRRGWCAAARTPGREWR